MDGNSFIFSKFFTARFWASVLFPIALSDYIDLIQWSRLSYLLSVFLKRHPVSSEKCGAKNKSVLAKMFCVKMNLTK